MPKVVATKPTKRMQFIRTQDNDKRKEAAGHEKTYEEDAPRPLVTHEDNLLPSFFSNVEVYINKQQPYNSKGSYGLKSHISNNFKGAISKHKVSLYCKGYDYEECLDGIMHVTLSEHSFTRRMKMLSTPNCFMLCVKMDNNFFFTSEVPYAELKVKLQLIRARPNFCKIEDNPYISLGNADCLL